MKVAHYITAHGYGHGVRSGDVIRAVLAADPSAEVAVSSGLGRDFLASRLPLVAPPGNAGPEHFRQQYGRPPGGPGFVRADSQGGDRDVPGMRRAHGRDKARPSACGGDSLEPAPGVGRVMLRERRLDVGMVQLDSVRADEEATLEALGRLLAVRGRFVDEEARWLEEWGADVVVADIPAIPLAAAAKAGIRRLAMGNFSWAWIYGSLRGKDRRWGAAEAAFLEDYAQAQLLLQLPFSPPMDEFRCPRIHVPLLAKAGRARREELARLAGADPAKRWTLLSFSTLEWGAEALRRVEAMAGDEFFTVEPLEWPGVRNVHAVRRAWMPFSDVVATVDAVVSKPGYGILSDCVANDKGLIYADRTDFAEYPVLVDAMSRYLKAVHLDARDLYAGCLSSALEHLATAPGPREALAHGGSEVAARTILAKPG